MFATFVPFLIEAVVSLSSKFFSNALTESIRFFQSADLRQFGFIGFSAPAFGLRFLFSASPVAAASAVSVPAFYPAVLGFEGCGGTTKSCFGGKGASSAGAGSSFGVSVSFFSASGCGLGSGFGCGSAAFFSLRRFVFIGKFGFGGQIRHFRNFHLFQSTTIGT